MNWNRCNIVIAPGQYHVAVASALRRLAGLVEADGVGSGRSVLVVALRAADDKLVGAATFSKVEDEC